jgi:chemotaxis protein MotA
MVFSGLEAHSGGMIVAYKEAGRFLGRPSVQISDPPMPKHSPFPQSSYSRIPVLAAIFGFVIILSSIALSTHSVLAFFSLEGLLIVGGGVIAVAFMSFPAPDVRKALNAIVRMFKEPQMTHENLHDGMMKIIDWASLAQEKTMRNLESSIGREGIDDPFIRYGLNMAVSQYEPEEVRAMMETASDVCFERDNTPVHVLQAMASHAPAFGMVGTLVGMVTMLYSLGDSLANIGPSLAVAFLSTLYGVVSARLVYMPAAARLRQEVETWRFRNQLITEGMVMLVSKKNPMYIRDHLNSFLRPEIHDYFDCTKIKTKPQGIIGNTVTPKLKALSA